MSIEEGLDAAAEAAVVEVAAAIDEQITIEVKEEDENDNENNSNDRNLEEETDAPLPFVNYGDVVNSLVNNTNTRPKFNMQRPIFFRFELDSNDLLSTTSSNNNEAKFLSGIMCLEGGQNESESSTKTTIYDSLSALQCR